MRLPPLNALRAFEAAARHEGFIGAAEELHVTRGAISRHVKLLEEHLGVALFDRTVRGVTLTEAGRSLLPVLSDAFGSIAAEAERLADAATDLRVICPPATSIRWLLPRLDGFRAAHPEIRVRLTTDFHGEAGFERADHDVGFSVENWPRRARGLEVQPLFPVLLSPACAPSLLGRIRRPEDLAAQTLLHETAERRDWRAWIEVFGVQGVDPRRGDVFSNLDIATKAAVMGSGVVMGDLALCRHELESGLLLRPFPDMVCASPLGRVCLLGPREKWQEPKVRAFRDWVAKCAAEQATSLHG